ncbi:MAG: DUF4197 domain-containing protein [Croceibacterium sp.]
MPELIVPNRRGFIGGAFAAAGALALPACTTYGGAMSLTEAIRRLLLLSSERAFVRLSAPGGFWDQQVAQIGLNGYFGNRGTVLSQILTSTLFKRRLEDQVARIAVDATYRAAPIVTDAVRTIGFGNALALLHGGPSAATAFLRQEMGLRLIDLLVPEIGNALRIAQDPLIGQLIGGLTGVDVGGVASSFAGRVENTIWGEIGREEADIRANPRASGDPLLTAALAANAAF